MLLCFTEERNPNLFRRPEDGSEVMTHEGPLAIEDLLGYLRELEPDKLGHLCWETAM